MTDHTAGAGEHEDTARALRSAIAEADPAALTAEDRLALLDFLGRAFAAAGIR